TKQQTPLPTQARKYDHHALHKFLDQIDILIIAVPLTSLTRQLIKKRELELLGSNGLLINVARGNIIDETSLFNALKDNTIAGAAVDFWYNYNPEKTKRDVSTHSHTHFINYKT
ncbi:MAG: hypothetical protein NWF11_00455, partial [Candidatus Bathyarchaeota archaeon]|nr:hypothetical protein [Candidatus Bathyarchaeota archaeon]